jgi:hypothetical protein
MEDGISISTFPLKSEPVIVVHGCWRGFIPLPLVLVEFYPLAF